MFQLDTSQEMIRESILTFMSYEANFAYSPNPVNVYAQGQPETCDECHLTLKGLFSL